MEESFSKLSIQELIAMMLQIKNEMETSDTKFAEVVRNLIKVFNNLNLTLLITKNVNSQLYSYFVIMERLGRCPVFLEIICRDCGYIHFSPR